MAVTQGMGKHMDELTDTAAVNTARWIFVINCVAIVTFVLPKPAIALLLARVLGVGGLSKRDEFILFGPATLIIKWTVATELLWICQCEPVSGHWNKNSAAKCLNPWIYTIEAIIFSVGFLMNSG